MQKKIKKRTDNIFCNITIKDSLNKAAKLSANIKFISTDIAKVFSIKWIFLYLTAFF